MRNLRVGNSRVLLARCAAMVRCAEEMVREGGHLFRVDGAGPWRFFKDILWPLSLTNVACYGLKGVNKKHSCLVLKK